jgi:UDP-N-acetylglucosamine acyltransferase
MKIHPTSVIQGEIDMADGAEIGPYCLIQGKVKIAAGTLVEGHATIGSKYGYVEIGSNNHFSPGAVIGGPPQDITYRSELTRLKIGNNNKFREFTTVNLATSKGDKETTIGDNNYFMTYTHIGHDCKIGNNVVIANDTHLGGHTVIEDNAVIGGVCAFNQFSKVGKFAFIAGGAVVNKDILPFSRARAYGTYALISATNKVGLLRNGFSKEDVSNIHKAIRIVVMGSETIDEALQRIQNECGRSEHIGYLLDFIKNSKRGLAIARKGGLDDEE